MYSPEDSSAMNQGAIRSEAFIIIFSDRWNHCGRDGHQFITYPLRYPFGGFPAAP
jgi:hypothetical protein